MLNSLFQLTGALIARVRREEGQTMAEYGILVAVIALIVILAATTLGSSISSVFSSVAKGL